MKQLLQGFIVPQVVAQYFESSVPELSLIEWAGEQLGNKEGIFVDIGAHVGTWSVKLANKFSHVHSFEPQKDVYNCLCGNIALAELSSRITPHNSAICSVYGKRTIHKQYDGEGGASLVIPGELNETIEANVLDTYRLQNVKLIKIDVEGNELNVLKSARLTLLNNDFPPILLECWNEEKGQDKTKLFEYIKGLGYRVFPINGYPEMFLLTLDIS